MRLLQREDATEEYASWLNDPDVNAHLDTKGATVEELRCYIAEKTGQERCLLLGIFEKSSGRHIGNIKLEPLDLSSGRATMGILIGAAGFRGAGYGTEALRALARWAFRDLGLREIDLGVAEANVPAISSYRKIGFRKTAERVGRQGEKVWVMVLTPDRIT